MSADSATREPGKLRLDHIDGMRATAALIVFLNHAFAQVYAHTAYPRGPLSAVSYSMVAGHLSVTVFIVVSGFCLALPVIQHGGTLRGGLATFFKRRARRILPPYYAAVALCLLLIATIIGEPTGTLWDVPIRVDTTSIISHLLLLQDLFGTSKINYVFWSIAVEWHIYFLMPLLVWAWARVGPAAVVTGALVVGYALRFGFADTRLARASPHFLGMFALGMLAAYLARSPEASYARLRQRVPWTLVAAAALVVAAGLSRYWGVGVSVTRFPYLDLPVGIMAAAALVASSQVQPNALTRIFSFRPLVVVGAFSYSVYLIHAPLLQVLWQYVLNPLGLDQEVRFALLMTVGLAIVIAAAYGFFLLFEAPFMRAPARAPEARPAVNPAP